MAKLIISLNILANLSTLLIFIPNACPSNLVIKPYDHSPICQGPQKSSKIQLYTHAIYSGPNQSVYEVANSSITETSLSLFGLVRAIDLKLTCGPDYDSRQVGRAQGVTISADLRELAFALDLNLHFISDEYFGSTITILGRYEQEAESRELSVVGGTGIFRCARGYMIATMYSTDVAMNKEVLYLEFNVDYVCRV